MNVRVCGVIMAMTSVLGLTACSAWAEEAKVKGVSWVYSVSDGKARLERLNQIYTGKLNVPATIGKYPVTSIGDGDHPIAAIPGPVSITVPASVTVIGEGAFRNCPKLSVVQTAQAMPTGSRR